MICGTEAVLPLFLQLLSPALLLSWPMLRLARQTDDWIPRGVEVLAQHATFHTDFTFDKTMLDLANNFVGDDDTRRIVAKLRGISVHSFRYPMPGMYDLSVLDTVRAQYHDRGWKHLVTAQSHADAMNRDVRISGSVLSMACGRHGPDAGQSDESQPGRRKRNAEPA